MKIAGICMVLLALALLCPSAFGDEVISGEGWTVTVKEIPYGDGPGEVGVVIEGVEGVAEGTFWGPKSFTVDQTGNIYILDTVNKRVQVYSTSVTFLYSIPLGKDWSENVIVDEQGRVYVLYRGGALIQYDRQGNVLSSIKEDEERWEGIYSPMFIQGNRIYMEISGDMVRTFPGFLVIAKIVGGKLKSPTGADLQKMRQKPPGKSGRIYSIQAKGKVDEVTVFNHDRSPIRTFKLTFPYNFGVWRFLGDDLSGSLFWEVLSRDKSDKKFLEIRKYGENGADISAAKIPAPHMFFDISEYFYIGENGIVYIVSPGRDKLELNIIKFE